MLKFAHNVLQIKSKASNHRLTEQGNFLIIIFRGQN
jgi:hypothetical protein